MAMTRSGLSSLMGYQEGGGVSEFEQMLNNAPAGSPDLASISDANAPTKQSGISMLQPFDFDTSVEKYQDRLSPYAGQQRPVSGYEAASMIGKGLLAQQAEKFPSIVRGLGMGFQDLSAEIKNRREQQRKERQAVAMKAMEMASEDEQQAQKFLNDYSLKLIDLANKDIKLTTLEYQNENGEVVKKSFKANDPEISEILAKGGVEVKTPQSMTNINMNQLNDLDKERAKGIAKTEQTWQVEADGAASVRDQIIYARNIAEQLGEKNFGPVEQFTVPIKGVLVDLGFGDLVDINDLSNQQLMGQLGTGFAMSLVGKTKGAISNKEMELFLRASPTLASTYQGFMRMLDYLDKIAERSEKFNSGWNAKSVELSQAGATIPEIQAALSTFKTDFRRDNPLFTKEEVTELESIKNDGVYSDISKGYSISSAKQTTNNAVNDRATTLMEQIENSEDLSPVQKAEKIAQIQSILGQ